MKKTKTIILFICALVVILLAAISPIVLCYIQEKSLLDTVHSEPLSTPTFSKEGEPLTASEKISLICNYQRFGSEIVITEHQNTRKKYSSQNDTQISPETILGQLDAMQALGAFPPIPLDKEFTLYSSTYYTYTDMQHPSRYVNLYDLSFQIGDHACDISMDADTLLVYQFKVYLNESSISYDTQSGFQAFCQYLSLDEEHKKLYYSISEDKQFIRLALKTVRSQ